MRIHPETWTAFDKIEFKTQTSRDMYDALNPDIQFDRLKQISGPEKIGAFFNRLGKPNKNADELTKPEETEFLKSYFRYMCLLACQQFEAFLSNDPQDVVEEFQSLMDTHKTPAALIASGTDKSMTTSLQLLRRNNFWDCLETYPMQATCIQAEKAFPQISNDAGLYTNVRNVIEQNLQNIFNRQMYPKISFMPDDFSHATAMRAIKVLGVAWERIFPVLPDLITKASTDNNLLMPACSNF